MLRNTVAVEERNPNVFGEGSEEIIRVTWNCTGEEAKLINCVTTPASCGMDARRRPAGVYCFGKDHNNGATEVLK